MYVPDITTTPSCNLQQYDYIPHNVTRAPQLPPTNFNRIGLAPWFSVDCTQAYLNAARFDPIRAFIFYKPDNSTDKPPDASDDTWDLEDRGAWRDSNFPIFAIPGLEGEKMMEQLSYYSGSVLEVPNGKELLHFAQSPQDYVRIWSNLTIHPPKSSIALWVYFLIVIGALIGAFAIVSLFMHFSQRRRRALLRRRVESGEVDLEAMGIKRLAVPAVHVKNFPLFTYTSTPINLPRTPTAESVVASSKSTRSSRRGISHEHRVDSLETGNTSKTLRSQRSAINGESDTIASNYQPHCHICLETYDDRITIIRELSCHHIFHPVCIDEFLTRNSSLCPVCKQSMLPRGYCPKITNSMVRRERALRKLRQQVDIDEESITSESMSKTLWSRLGFRRHSRSDTMNEYQMSSIEEEMGKGPSPDSSSNEPHSPSEASSPDVPAPPPAEPAPPQKPSATKKAKTKASRPRAISVMPTQPEEAVLKTTGTVGRHSPSSFARERMRQIADKNAPFEDPDLSRPACKFHLLHKCASRKLI